MSCSFVRVFEPLVIDEGDVGAVACVQPTTSDTSDARTTSVNDERELFIWDGTRQVPRTTISRLNCQEGGLQCTHTGARTLGATNDVEPFEPKSFGHGMTGRATLLTLPAKLP